MRCLVLTVILLSSLACRAQQYHAFRRAERFTLSKPAGVHKVLADTSTTPILQLQPGDTVTVVGAATVKWYVLDQPTGSTSTRYYIPRDSLLGAYKVPKLKRKSKLRARPLKCTTEKHSIRPFCGEVLLRGFDSLVPVFLHVPPMGCFESGVLRAVNKNVFCAALFDNGVAHRQILAKRIGAQQGPRLWLVMESHRGQAPTKACDFGDAASDSCAPIRAVLRATDADEVIDAQTEEKKAESQHG